MMSMFQRLFRRHNSTSYARRRPLILINGLAEQAESWFRNIDAWRRHFDVHMPALLDYESAVLDRRIEDGLAIDVNFLVEKLKRYLEESVRTGPPHLVANSLGGKNAVEFAVRYPELVDRLVLLCPSGLSDEERLPVVEGVRRNFVRAQVGSVFYNPRWADRSLLDHYQSQFRGRRWKSGLLRTILGTMDHCVRDRLDLVTQPTLLVVGSEDRIVDPRQAMAAARRLPRGKLVVLQRCGHAPQMERARIVNRLVVQFLGQS